MVYCTAVFSFHRAMALHILQLQCLATFCCSWSKRERQTIKCPPQSIPNRQPRHRNLFLLPISLFIGFDKGWFTYIITKNHPPPNRFWRFSLLKKILNIALRILSVKGGKKWYHPVPSYTTLFSIPVPSQFIVFLMSVTLKIFSSIIFIAVLYYFLFSSGKFIW